MHTANEILAVTAAVRAALTAVLDHGVPVHQAVTAAVQAHLGGASADIVSTYPERPAE